MVSKDVMGRVSMATVRWATWAALLGLTACGGGGSSGGSSGGGGGGGGGSSYTLGGTVSGLGNNSGLVLANGSTTLSVSAGATTFTFPTALASGAAYSVTVQSAPSGMNCTVAGGSGTITANVTSVAVTCTSQSYTLGGTVTVNPPTGTTLSDQGMVLTNTSNGDTYKFTASATSFTMPKGVSFGSAYAVTVSTQPTFLNCSVANGSGTMPASNVTNVQITCAGGSESVLHSFGGAGDGADPQGNLMQASDGNFYGVTGSGGANGNGTVFKITPGGTETVIYSFGAAPDGINPYGTLLQANDGNLYGTTQAGGAHGEGTVFKITTAGAESVLYSFGAPPDGSSPYGGLIQAKDGNLYGMTSAGGAGYGTIFKITLLGVESVLHSFRASNDGNFPYGGLIQGKDTNFYGMTHLGGVGTNLGTVFKISTGGTETVLHSFGAPGDGSTPYDNLLQASDGNLYGTTSVGGANGVGTVFMITTSGTETVLHSFGAAGDGVNPYGRLIQGSDGALYGLTQQGGAHNFGTVFQITTAGAEAVLYSFGGGTTDGTSPKYGLLQASDGTLYGLAPQGGTSNVGVVFAIN